MDSTLTWKHQIYKICKTICRSIGVLYKIRPYVNLKILKTLYYSLIYPYLTYAIEVWGLADNTHLNHIVMLQKRTVRMINYSDKRQPDFAFPSVDPLFLKLGFLKFHNIFKLKITKCIYNSLNKHNPKKIHSLFKLTTQTHNHNTRSKYIDIVGLSWFENF